MYDQVSKPAQWQFSVCKHSRLITCYNNISRPPPDMVLQLSAWSHASVAERFLGPATVHTLGVAVKNKISVQKSQYKGLDVNQQGCSRKNGDSIRYPGLGSAAFLYQAYLRQHFLKTNSPRKCKHLTVTWLLNTFIRYSKVLYRHWKLSLIAVN